MKIKIISQYYYNPLPKWAELSKQRLINYCRSFNYDLSIVETRLYKDRCITWDKMLAVRDAMEEGSDYVVYIDADIYINKDLPFLEHIIEKYPGNLAYFDCSNTFMYPNLQLVANLDKLGVDFTDIRRLSTCFMIWKVCEESKNLLADFLKSDLYSFWFFNGWWEETALEMYLNKMKYRNIHIFNSFEVVSNPYRIKKDAYLFHFVGKDSKLYMVDFLLKWSKHDFDSSV